MLTKTRIKSSKPEVAGLLYDKYAPAVYSVITSIISDETKAGDVLSNIFRNLSREIENYEHKESLLLWLINLSRNQCISKLIEDNEKTKTADLNSYVSELPLLERTIFALVYFKGLDIYEVSVLLHMPLKSIEPIFKGLPNFTPYLFPNIKKDQSPVPDMLQSLMENLIPENDEERVAALRRYKIQYSSAEETFDNITRTVARVFETPMCFLSLVDRDAVFYKSQFGPFGKSRVKREDSLCSLTILSKEPLVIEDASLETCFDNNPYVKAENGIKFYAGAPLITQDGYHIGALCIVDTKSRIFSFKDSLLLVEFTEMAMREIETRHNYFQRLLFEEQLFNAKARE